MRRKHKYVVVFNNEAKYEKNFSYNYGHVNDISIGIAFGHAIICFDMNVEKNIDDFVEFRVGPFKDAFSKCYLLHTLQFGVGLQVNKIDIYIDDVKTEVTNEKVFPLLYSMIPDRKLGISKGWRSLCDNIVTVNKSIINKDTRYSAVYAYLSSKSKEYEIDKFQNLWTSVNAIYTYIAKCYEKSLRIEFNLEQDQALHKSVIFSGKDGSCIGMMAYLFEPKYKRISPDESKRLYNEYMNAEKIISKIDISSLATTYNELLADVNVNDNSVREKYSELYSISDIFNVSPYIFLILCYPYYWRCRYFHGNFALPLFMAHNDNDLKVLYVLNYFIDRFLDGYILETFKDGFWNEEKYKLSKLYIMDCEEDASNKIKKNQVAKS